MVSERGGRRARRGGDVRLGALHLFAWDIEDTCEITHFADYDPAYDIAKLFPPSRRCNAGYDLVPTYVTPAVIAFAITALVCVIVAMKTE